MNKNIKSILVRLFSSDYTIFIVLLIIIVFGIVSHPTFSSSRNLINIMRQISVLLIVAVGQNIVILTGGIDLSVSSIISFISVILVGMLSIIGTPLSILVVLSIGFIVGAINGFIITRFKVMPFLATFCFYAIYQGLALFIDKGACRNIIELNFLKIFSFSE